MEPISGGHSPFRKDHSGMSRDIGRDPSEHGGVPDDDIVIPTLPDPCRWQHGQPVGLPRNTGTVGSNDRTQRTGSEPMGSRVEVPFVRIRYGSIDQFDHPMDMIRHDRERMDPHMGMMPCNIDPMIMCYAPDGIQFNIASNSASEQRLSDMCAEGYEIQAHRCVIMCALPDGTTMVPIRVEPWSTSCMNDLFHVTPKYSLIDDQPDPTMGWRRERIRAT